MAQYLRHALSPGLLAGFGAPPRRCAIRGGAATCCQSVETTRVIVEGEATTRQLTLKMAACNLPHPAKASYGGEDAFFVSDVGGGALGIADGVGGWAESGVNPAEYSKSLMATARGVLEGDVDVAAALSKCETDFSISVLASVDEGQAEMGVLGQCVRTSLAVAHAQTRLPGSATAVVLRMDQQSGAIQAANLGDSGFIVVRGSEVIFRTEPMEHFFDCPKQFGAYPEHAEATDTVDDVETHDVRVSPGDVVVAGSDGLWDNLHLAELLPLVPGSAGGVEQAADAIAAAARHNSEDPSYASPYTDDARAQGLDLPPWEKLLGSSFKGGKFELGKLQGGKQDDITVVVAFVEEGATFATQPDAAEEQAAAAEAGA